MKLSKILFSSDLHGSDMVFSKLLNAAIANKVDAIVIGGDLSGKTITPIIDVGNGVFKTNYLGTVKVVNNVNAFNQIERDINNIGSYPIVLSIEQIEKLNSDENFKKSLFLKATIDKLRGWLNLAQLMLKPHNIRLIMICGNDDYYELDEVIEDSGFAENPERKIVIIADKFEFFGDSSSTITPFDCPRDISEDEIKQRILNRLKSISDFHNAIFVFHTPPFNSSLDNVIDVEFDGVEYRHKLVSGQPLIVPAGSRAIRDIIEKFQPLFSLHGHIHESPGEYSIGRTVCFNPGSDYSYGYLRSYLITFVEGRIVGRLLLKH